MHQEVTGLTVNVIPNVKRCYIKTILGALHAWEKYGYENASKVYLREYLGKQGKGLELDNVLRGKINFLKMVNGDSDPVYRKIACKFNKLSKTQIKITGTNEIQPCSLPGGHPNEPWKVWFNKYKDSLAFLEISIDGSINQATGFYIGSKSFATAGHNLEKGLLTAFSNETNLSIDEKRNRVEPFGVDVGLLKIKEKLPVSWFPFQFRLPEIGEEIATIGFPRLPLRNPSLVLHVGVVESLPVSFQTNTRFIQVSFQSGGGLSGSPLIDKRGYVIGIMIENIYMDHSGSIPQRPYGQAIPIEYFSRFYWDM